jgi:hypothetical protein
MKWFIQEFQLHKEKGVSLLAEEISKPEIEGGSYPCSIGAMGASLV